MDSLFPSFCSTLHHGDFCSHSYPLMSQDGCYSSNHHITSYLWGNHIRGRREGLSSPSPSPSFSLSSPPFLSIWIPEICSWLCLWLHWPELGQDLLLSQSLTQAGRLNTFCLEQLDVKQRPISLRTALPHSWTQLRCFYQRKVGIWLLDRLTLRLMKRFLNSRVMGLYLHFMKVILAKDWKVVLMGMRLKTVRPLQRLRKLKQKDRASTVGLTC